MQSYNVTVILGNINAAGLTSCKLLSDVYEKNGIARIKFLYGVKEKYLYHK